MPRLGRFFVVCLLALLPLQLRAQVAATDQFTLGPGDLLQIQIWREKDLSGKFQVDESGAITVPMLGRIPAAGIPWHELRDSLLSGYSRQLRTTSIILTPASQQIRRATRWASR